MRRVHRNTTRGLFYFWLLLAAGLSACKDEPSQITAPAATTPPLVSPMSTPLQIPTDRATPMDTTIPPTWTPVAPTMTVTAVPGRAALPGALYLMSIESLVSSVRGADHGVWRLEPGSSEVEPVTPAGVGVTAFDIWSGDGRMAYGTVEGKVFVFMAGEHRLLYEARTDGGQPLEIGSLSWSPRGARLAFTARSQEEIDSGSSAGLWLLDLEDGEPELLLANRYLDRLRPDVNEVRVALAVDWSPDGEALLLRFGFWEWQDVLWLEPISPEPAESDLHDPLELWSEGAWAEGGRSILLSGLTRGLYSDLARVDRDTGELEILVDGTAEELSIYHAQEISQGIVFAGRSMSGENRMYHGPEAEGEFEFAPAGPARALCEAGYIYDMAWDETSQLAAVACEQQVLLVSVDGTTDIDLTPMVEAAAGPGPFMLFWGPAGE